MLLTCEGKLTGGPCSGSYVSSRPSAEQVGYAHALLRGETLNIHLMHRHLGGKRDVSSLRWQAEGLVMVYSDREELA